MLVFVSVTGAQGHAHAGLSVCVSAGSVRGDMSERGDGLRVQCGSEED